MLGIFLAEKMVFYHPILLVLLLFAFLAIFYCRQVKKSFVNRWIPSIPIHLFLLLAGYLLTYYQHELRHPTHFQKNIQAENYVIGTIKNIPTIKNRKIKVELLTQAIGTNRQNLTVCKGRLLVYLNQNDTTPLLNYGDQILLKSRLQPIQKPSNPKAFDYRRYLYFKQIHFQSFVRQQNWTILTTHQGAPFWLTINKIRHHYLQVLKKYIPSDKEMAIAAALILGYKATLTPELKNAYSETGAIHVLAVSGLHVGIISAVLLMLLNLFPFQGTTWNWLKFIGLCLGIWGFACLTGLPPSVKRAALMFTFLNIGLLVQRDINKYNLLAIAAFFILLLHPYALFDIGFQFSFLAVIGIIFFAKRILQFWSPTSRWLYEIWNLMVVSFSAQLTIFPLMLYYFHQIPTYFWLSSLFVVPLAGLLMNLGLLLLLLSSVHEMLAAYLGQFISWLIYAQNCLIEGIQHLPLHLLTGFWISEVEVVLFYGVLLGIVMLLLTNNGRWVIMALSCIVVVSCVQLGTKLNQIQQQQIIVYDLPKKSAIDFIDGATIYALADSSITEKDYIYNIQSNRWANGINEVIPIKKERIQTSNFFKKGNLFQFYDTKLAIINQALPKKESIQKRLVTDYLIIQHNPKIKIADLLHYYDFKTIIFDGSNTSWATKHWTESCQQLTLPYHDVKQDGAFVVSLNGQ